MMRLLPPVFFGSLLFLACGVVARPLMAATPSPAVVDFDVDTLKALGYGAEIADYFKSGSQFFPGRHDVTISVNGGPGYATTVTTGDQGQLCVTPELLTLLRLKSSPARQGCEALSGFFPDAQVRAWPGRFAFDIVVPEGAFDEQLRGEALTTGGLGLLSNYRLYGMRMENQNTQQFYQGQFETGMNLSNWVLRNNSSFTSGRDHTAYEFNETTLSRAIAPLRSVLEMGQISSQGMQFGGTPLNGFQLYSDTSQQESGKLQVPVTGVAEVPATVEVSQNGRLLYRTLVPAGPFQLDRVNGVSAGQPLDISVLQGDGRTQRYQVTTAQAYNRAPGPVTYQLAVGTWRMRGGGESDRPLLVSLEGDRGIGPAQLSGGGQLSAPYQTAGSRVALLWPGESSMNTSAGVTGARSRDGTGVQVDAGGGISPGAFSLGVSTLMRSAQYPTLESALQRQEPPDSGGGALRTGQDRALKRSTSLSLGWGSILLGRLGYSLGVNQFYGGKGSTLLHTLSYGRKLGDASLSMTFQTANDRDSRLFLSVSMPLGKRASVSGQMQRYQGQSSYTSTFTHQPEDLWGYSLGVTRNGEQNQLTGSAQAITAYSQLSASGSWGDDQSRSAMLSASGALAYAEGALVTSPYALGDTFGVVRVPGQLGVRVSAPGGGTTMTNFLGTAALPSIPVNSKTTVQLDTKNLPLNVRLDSTSFDVAVARGTVISRKIRAVVMKQLLLDIRMADGSPAPAGATALDDAGALAGIVTGNGNLMLSNEDIEKPLLLRMPNRSDCVLRFRVPSSFDPGSLYEEAGAECR